MLDKILAKKRQIMKNIKKLLFLTMMSVLLFSCKDNAEKTDSDENSMNMEKTEMNQITNGENEGQIASKVEDESTVADVMKESKNHSTLLKAMEKAGIIVKLSGTDEYTVFAPTNSAFDELPSGTINDWMKPENSEELEAVLSYHIIPGKVDSEKLKDLIKSNHNKYVLVTGNDGELTATLNDAGNIILTDAAGNQSTVISLDMRASNGVVHSINRVLMRK